MILEPIKQHHRLGLILLLIAGFAILLFTICAGSVAASDYNVAYGETVKISVNNPFGGTAYLYIQGENFPFSPLKDESGNQLTVSGRGIRTVEFKTSNLHADTGTYTIYVSNNPKATSTKNLDSGNGFWDAYTLTLRPIGVTVDVNPTVVATPSTPVPTLQPTSMPTTTPTPTPASPAPFIAVIAGLGAAVLALRR